MALLIKSDGTREEITGAGPDGSIAWDQIKKAIGGGYVEHVVTDPDRAEGYSHIWLDEEGKNKGFPRNAAATALSVYTAWDDILSGDVLFCTEEEEDLRDV